MSGKNPVSSILRMSSMFFRFWVSLWKSGLKALLMGIEVEGGRWKVEGLLISSVVSQSISGVFVCIDHIKLPIFNFEF